MFFDLPIPDLNSTSLLKELRTFKTHKYFFLL